MGGLSQFIATHWPQALTFLFVLGRTSGLVISAPFWGGATVPTHTSGHYHGCKRGGSPRSAGSTGTA